MSFLPVRESIALAALLGFAQVAAAQIPTGEGSVWIPDSSMAKPGEAGRSVHTNIKAILPTQGAANLTPRSLGNVPQSTGTPTPGLSYETPASIACIYQLVTPLVPGCDPNTVTANPVGGSGAIAIVDAYDYPTAAADLNTFSTQFGLSAANFTVVYAKGTKPTQDSGWNLEAALDIEWAHAMAPGAKLYLVEAASNSFADMFAAVAVATTLVNQNGGGQVSMSWGSPEFPNETQYDAQFTTPGVVYLASVGDSPGVSYPSASRHVISAGGTTTARNPVTGAFETEIAWQSSGGGPSLYETRPVYQNGISAMVGAARGTPDLSFDSNPFTGVWVYNSTFGGYWWVVGGTSVAAPSLAGIINLAGHRASSSSTELTMLYQNRAKTAEFKDISSGDCGAYGGYLATKKWDFCTGIGSILGLAGK